MQAKAALDDAQRNLDLTTVRAPMNGIATQVDQIQLGRFVIAGTPVFSVIDTSKPWVDANPKESDFTYVAVGQPVTIEVDAFPNHTYSRATVGSPEPGHRGAIRDPAGRRTLPETSSRWCSACRCGSTSTTMTNTSGS